MEKNKHGRKYSLAVFIGWGLFFVFLYSPPTYVFGSDNNLGVTSHFLDFLKKEKLDTTDRRDLKKILIFPLNLRETAYEIEGDSCYPKYKDTLINNINQLEGILSRLKTSWSNTAPSHFNDNSVGIAEEGDCLHYSIIRLNEKKTKIIGIMLDSETIYDPHSELPVEFSILGPAYFNGDTLVINGPGWIPPSKP